MDRFFINDKMKANGEINNLEDVKHISKVLRLKKADRIEIVDSEGQEYICEIEEIEKNAVIYRSLEKVSIIRELPIRLQVYQGVPKGQKMEIIVQKLTEIGVSDIYPVNFKRCVSQIKEEKEEKKINRYQKIAYEGAKQSKRTRIPKIHSLLDFSDLPISIKENQLNLLFYENQEKINLKEFFRGISWESIQSVGLIIGPEGGLTPEEVEKLSKENCHILSLGNRILRTETAGIVAASLVAYEIDNEIIWEKGGANE